MRTFTTWLETLQTKADLALPAVQQAGKGGISVRRLAKDDADLPMSPFLFDPFFSRFPCLELSATPEANFGHAMFATYTEVRSEFEALVDEFASQSYKPCHLNHVLTWPPSDCWNEGALDCFIKENSRGERERWKVTDDGFCHRFWWSGDSDHLDAFHRLVRRGEKLLRDMAMLIEVGDPEIPCQARVDLPMGNWLEQIHQFADQYLTSRLWADVVLVRDHETITSRLSLDAFSASAEFLRVLLDDYDVVWGNSWPDEDDLLMPFFLPASESNEEFTSESGRRSPPKDAVAVPMSEWYTLDQAAQYLGITAKQLRSRCKKRQVKCRREGTQGRGKAGQYRFRREWLDEYATAATTTTTTTRVQSTIKPRLSTSRVQVKSYIPESEWGSSLVQE